jgi:hypothetical protein
MKRITIAGILLISLVAVSVGVAAEDKLINIVVSPHTLNLESHGNGVTVHTNIAYADVNCSTVTLKVEGADITIRSCYPDLCGDLVVKVDRDAVVDAIGDSDASTEADFTLTGFTTSEDQFTGTDTIRVIEVAASSKK